ncbi:DUF4180 domain-containing protein [Kibdelosporangium lantanae]|uniref:DUF4180 domain-containing protein n=1 Tax=Kibdelosporangium lantanae TaxID=1497396 RepID=A0ABW3M5X1_9PSEU
MLLHIADVPVYLLDTEGPVIADDREAVDLIVAAGRYGAGADWTVIPVSRLGDDFFELRTRKAGAIVQKFVSYQMKLAVIGDISARVAASESLAAWVRESNRGRDLWFVSDVEELRARLGRQQPAV